MRNARGADIDLEGFSFSFSFSFFFDWSAIYDYPPKSMKPTQKFNLPSSLSEAN
jgi:hypothetical protein